jgi:hypothetical protein
MTMTTLKLQGLQPVRAIEALRSGVPSRDAVLALGCAQPDIERRFRARLESVAASHHEPPGAMVPGLLIEGGFGSGKSHLLEYLRHVALAQNFVVSKVVVSKETPLHDPIRLYRAAIEAAQVPDRRGAAVVEVAAHLDAHGEGFAALQRWSADPAVGLNQRFAASLRVHAGLGHDPSASHCLARFWSGDQFPPGDLKKYMRACGEPVSGPVEKIGLTELALQRFAFAPRLMVAAGYAGWVLLIDEVELVGRYAFRQRAKSYAELARWMGLLEDSRFAGLVSVLAITDDFQSAVLQEREDLEKVPGKLRARGTETDITLASQAELGMRAIQRERLALSVPTQDMLHETYHRVQALHGQAYDWTPPAVVSSVEALSTTRMREYIKRWITEWDLRRLDPDYRVEIEASRLQVDYAEDESLLVPSEEESA